MKKVKVGMYFLILALILALSACSSKSSNSKGDGKGKSEQKELVIVDWGGASSDAFKKTKYEPFEKKYGVKVKVVSPVDYGQLYAMLKSGNVIWDLVIADENMALKLAAEGNLEKLDFNIIDKTNIDPQVVTDYSIGNYHSATVISYNTELIDPNNHPKTWADVWDTKKFPGERTLSKIPISVLEVALLADGVNPDELYPLDVDRAFASLDKIKKHVKNWWSAGAQPIEMLDSKDVSVAGAWSGRIVDAKRQGLKMDVEYNQAVVQTASYIIPKGAPNKDLAQKYIAFASQPEPQAEFAKIMNYGPTNLAAIDLLTEDEKILLGEGGDGDIKKVYVDYKWWMENIDEVNDRFNKWLLE
ncbi:ABC transporter substrate-binding protein [Neobacillus sp. 19]|uniref:ABC transporter substrate-binding protein n=1 Tax=Neobacillus sp. 19 TaxID=3394458 RepID=UPI003BF6B731